MSFCEIILVGNLGKDAELKYTDNALAFVNFNLAVSGRVKVNNQWQDETTWWRISYFGSTAERISDFLKTGQMVIVTGDQIEARPYVTGNNEMRVSLSLVARNVRLLGRKGGGQDGGGGHYDSGNYDSGGNRGGGNKPRPTSKPQYDDFPDDRPSDVDDIPF